MDSISEQRLIGVNPLLASRVRRMAAILAAEGIYIRVTQALRTWVEQDALYAQGRSSKFPGNIVTNAKGGESFHNYGLAVDLVPDEFPDDGKFTPDWNSSHPSWKRMIDVGIECGLTSGAAWRSRPDMPHFELTGKFPTNHPDPYMQGLYAQYGIEKVWEAVNMAYPTSDIEIKSA